MGTKTETQQTSPAFALRPYQLVAARAILDSVRHRRGLTFSVMVSRQGGKNELSAQLEALLLLQNLDREADGIKCAPSFQPQGLVSLRRLWARLHDLLPEPLARLEGGNAIRAGRARQLFFSAAPGANVVGHTCSLLLEVDEAQDVDAEKFDKDFRPMAASTGATTVYYGTAWAETDLLATVRRRHLEMERADGVRRHFEFDWETVARYVPAYAAYVAAERARLGEEHPLFRTQYGLRPLAGGGRLFSPAQRELLAGHHPREHTPSATQAGGRVLGYVAALDVGGESLVPFSRNGPGSRGGLPSEGGWGTLGSPIREKGQGGGGGPDCTVLTIARVVEAPANAAVREPAIEIVEHAAWQGAAHADLVGGIARLVREVWRCSRLVIDATGVGEGLASTLATMHGSPGPAPPEVVRLRLTEERKSALGYGLLAATNAGRLRLYRGDGSPEHRALWTEIELARAEYRPNRRLAWFVDPAEGHDDYLMSLALAVEAAREMRPRSARGRIEE